MCNKILTLRAFRTEDQERILEILTDPAVKQTYMLPDFKTTEDAIPLFRRFMELSLDQTRYVCCISLDEKPVGFLNDVEIKDGSIELGYAIHPDSQGHGYMSAALRAAIDELLDLGYEKVICGAFEENIASIRVMEKAGMKRIDRSEKIEYRGKIHLCVYYMKEKSVKTC